MQGVAQHVVACSSCSRPRPPASCSCCWLTALLQRSTRASWWRWRALRRRSGREALERYCRCSMHDCAADDGCDCSGDTLSPPPSDLRPAFHCCRRLHPAPRISGSSSNGPPRHSRQRIRTQTLGGVSQQTALNWHFISLRKEHCASLAANGSPLDNDGACLQRCTREGQNKYARGCAL